MRPKSIFDIYRLINTHYTRKNIHYLQGGDLSMGFYKKHKRCSVCPPETIIAHPKKVYRDFCHPQIVKVIHPIEIINRHHCVPVYKHSKCYTMRDEFYR